MQVTFKADRKDGEFFTLDGEFRIVTPKYVREIFSLNELHDKEKQQFLLNYLEMERKLNYIKEVL